MSLDMFMMPAGDEGDQPEEPPPPWSGPPRDELGVAVQFGTVLGRSGRGVVALSHALVYSTGVALQFTAAAKGLSRSEAMMIFHEQHMFDRNELPDGLLRIGLELPGGARVTNLSDQAGRFSEDEPEGPVFVPCGGGGGEGGRDRVLMRHGYWLWPLPEPGSIRVGCEWPVVDVALATVEIDGAALVAAGAASTKLWP